MRSTIKKYGNSRGLTIPPSTLEQLGWKEGTEVDIEIANGALVILKLAPSLEELIATVPAEFRDTEEFGDDDVGRETVE